MAESSLRRLPSEQCGFGVHRLNTPEAETAPAWPALAVVERLRIGRFKREQRKALVPTSVGGTE